VHLWKSAAGKVLLGCFLSGIIYAGATRSGLTLIAASPASIFVANPNSAALSVYPSGSFGNVLSQVTNPELVNPGAIALDSAGNIYAANPGVNAITVYAAGASGAPNPVAMITGSNTGLDYPTGVALDSSGNLYVANAGSSLGNTDSITVFPPNSNGNVTPTAVITGANTGLNLPLGLALDSSGNIYVANEGSQNGGADSITVYPPNSNGNVTPTATITGGNTGLSTPVGIALDSSANIYVAEEDYNGGDPDGSFEVFAAGSNGNVAPTRILYGTGNGLDTPVGIAVDSAGNIYVANNGGWGTDPSSVAIYAPGCNMCATLVGVIESPTINLAAGLTLDSQRNVYVSDASNNGIYVFQSSGNYPLIETIADPNTGMDYPLGVAFDTSANIYVADAASQNGGYDSVEIYPAGSNANVAPMATISSGGAPDNTGLNYPDAVAVGVSGHIHVANALGGYNDNGTVTVYLPGSNGNVAPSATLSGSSTGLNYPIGLAIGSGGNLHVLNAYGGPDYAGSVTVYNTSTSTINGNVAPINTISGNASGDQTGFDNPSGIALDSGSNIYVTNDGSASGGADSVTIYPEGQGGNLAPMATISGPLTQLNLPSGIAVDSSGNIYVANEGSQNGGADSITVYPPNSNGNVAPAMLINGTITGGAVISGSLTGLNQPDGIALSPGS